MGVSSINANSIVVFFTTNESSPVNVKIMNIFSDVLSTVVIQPWEYARAYLSYPYMVERIYEREDGLLIASNDSRTFSVAIVPNEVGFHFSSDSFTLYPVETYGGVKIYT